MMITRLTAFCAVLVTALALGAVPALANHSGAEHIAKGRGATDLTNTQSATQLNCDFVFIGACAAVTTTTTTSGGEQFSFSARSTSTGEPHGSMRIDFTRTTRVLVTVSDPFFICNVFVFCPAPSDTTTSQSAVATADVTCLSVVNNRATVGGRVTKFDGTFPPTRGLVFNATDNTIARQQVAPDRFVSAFAPEAPQVCPPPSADRDVTSGDVLVLES